MKKLLAVFAVFFCFSFLPILGMADGCGEYAININDHCWCCSLFGCWYEGDFSTGRSKACVGGAAPDSYCATQGTITTTGCPDVCPWWAFGTAEVMVAYEWPGAPECRNTDLQEPEPLFTPITPDEELQIIEASVVPLPEGIFKKLTKSLFQKEGK